MGGPKAVLQGLQNDWLLLHFSVSVYSITMISEAPNDASYVKYYTDVRQGCFNDFLYNSWLALCIF